MANEHINVTIENIIFYSNDIIPGLSSYITLHDLSQVIYITLSNL